MSALRLLLLGPPGVGKGTQAARLAARAGIPQISTGEMLRAAVAAKTEVGCRAQAIMERGELVPDELVIAVAEQRLALDDARKGFILDGFPRTTAQAIALDELLERMGAQLSRCAALVADGAELVARLLSRAQIEDREDDSEQTIRTRMRVYREQTAPLVDYYRDRGLLVEVDALGSVDEVASRLEEAITS